MEQTTVIMQPEGALTEAIEGLQATLSGQTTLIYVLMAIAALSLIIALAALSRGKSVAAQPLPTQAAPAAPKSAPAGDAAVVAAITGAIACLLSQERAAGGLPQGSPGFVVRRIRRV